MGGTYGLAEVVQKALTLLVVVVQSKVECLRVAIFDLAGSVNIWVSILMLLARRRSPSVTTGLAFL